MFLYSVFFLSIIPSASSDDITIELALKGIEKTILYYSRNYQDMILDGIFGLRIMQGQVLMMEKMFKEKAPDNKYLKYFQKLKDLSEIADQVANNSIKHLIKTNADYMKTIGWVTMTPWTYASDDIKHVNPEYFKEYNPIYIEPSAELEKLTDACMGEVSRNCKMTDTCLKFLTSETAMSYELTHQILYIISIHMFNCTDDMNDQIKEYKLKKKDNDDNNDNSENIDENNNSLVHRNDRDTDDMLKYYEAKFCAFSFLEMSILLKKHNSIIPIHLVDIFSEHLFICPAMGYIQFLHKHWLMQLMLRQEQSGCWSLDAYLVNEPMYHDMMGLQTQFKRVRKGRKLLEEKTLKDGCSNHLTAVALSSAIMYTRYLLIGAFVDESFNIPEINYLMEPEKLPGFPYPKKEMGEERELDRKMAVLFYLLIIFLVLSLIYLLRRFLRGFYFLKFFRVSKILQIQLL